MAFEMSAVTVRRVLAEADIADNHELWHSSLDGLDGTLHRARRVPGRRAIRILVLRQAEDLDSGDAECRDLLGELDGIVDREVIAVRHARDLFLDMLTRDDEDRIDEVLCGKSRLPDHGAHGRRDAHAARTKLLVIHNNNIS